MDKVKEDKINSVKRLGQGLDSITYWKELSCNYVNELEGPYHNHRLSVINALIPKSLFSDRKTIFDFGCGDAVLFPQFLENGAIITGIDIAPEMVSLAHERLRKNNYDPAIVSLGGAEQLGKINSQSLDALLSFNVLAYLTEKEEALFYQQASRTIKPGGFLIVTHSNELFDLFSLNKYTVDFFRKYLVVDQYKDKIKPLITNSDKPEKPTLYNVRENPLIYQYKLKRYGFRETRQEFINLHDAPPPLLNKNKSFSDTRLIKEPERWKLLFICSIFGSCAIRE